MKTNPTTGSTFFPKGSWKSIIVFILGSALFFSLTGKIYQIRGKYVTETVSGIGQLPSSAIRAASLEFQGIVSDYLLFKTITYLGLRIGEDELPSTDEWQVIHQMLEKVTDLDPRFLDPYLFAEMMLVWQAGMFDEANELLEKAAINLPKDYRPNYFIGFNHMYFKKDAEKAAPYLRQAAECPNAPQFLKGLASRVSVYAGELKVGIFFLESMMQDTQDPTTLAYFEKRLTAMKRMLFLEEKAMAFKQNLGAFPETLEELVSSGMIPAIPEDPYGGKFVLLKNGRVYTTSEMVVKDD